MKPLLLDTGVIVALLDRSESHHERCRRAMQENKRPLVTCEAVIAESCYLLRNLPGAGAAVVANVERGIFQIRAPLANSASEVRKLMAKYSGHRIDLADACLIALAGELGTGDILTLDSEFVFYRWARNQPFQTLPAA
jgi:predicted nucleic acid-binding protein